MRNLKIAATVFSLSVLAGGDAFALGHYTSNRTYFQRESAKAAPQVDQAPATEAPAPKAHKKHKRKS